MTITTLLILIILIYLACIGCLVLGFGKVNEFQLRDLPASTKFTIIIPFRNEADNLGDLLNSIGRLNYPKANFEIILVNDASSDHSLEVIKNYLKNHKTTFNNTIRVLENKRQSTSPKKDAINQAIKHANNDWIITTDADCILPKFWLNTYDEFIQRNETFAVVGPVSYHYKNTFFNRFQTLDFLSLQGATIGGFGISKAFMCNGANFCYQKSVFKKVDGFIGNTHIASGDDIFLLEKFIKLSKTKVHYLKSDQCIVLTKPTNGIRNLIQQRLRWASKTSNYNNWFSKLIGLTVLSGNLACIALIPITVEQNIDLRTAFYLFIIKIAIDFLLLFKTLRFFKQDNLMLSYLLSSFIYPLFNVSIAFFSFFSSYSWKGRSYKK